MSSRTDFGVAPINNEPIQEKRKKKVLKSKQNIEKSLKFKVFVQNSKTNHSHTNYCSSKKMKKEKKRAEENFEALYFHGLQEAQQHEQI
jgi:hypothetical protein